MTVQIDPVILRKLDDFSQRRRKLIIWRGLLAAGATLLLAMMFVALIDALFVLPDVARWSLSGAAYLTVLIVEWRASLRLLIHPPGRRDLARMVETTEPGLRENLLSAVELSEADHEALGTSTQFRRLLESSVSQHLSRTDMDALLPVQLVRRSILAGLLAFVLCLAAFVLTGRQFGTLLLRALAPGANLARVSQVQVRILEPTQPEKVVAQGETEPIVIEISGKRVNAARLETITAEGRSVLKMTPAGQDRFSASIQIGREDVIYRVFAGDAVTQKFRLRAVARPHIVGFGKTFTFPSYVGREPHEVTEENGDLIALEGSQVELRLTPSQAVREGELRIEQGGKSSTVKLEPADGALTAQVPLNTSGTYRVHLVGAETGFENKFSPEYELRAEPDLVPQIELDSPKQDLLLPANEIVTLRGTASDDQGLARVTQVVKMNEGPWREIPIAKTPGKSAAIEHRWDLYEQGAKPGDLLSTKLLAVDLKGARAESRVLRISVTKSGFETKRLGALEAQRRLYETLQALRAAGEQFSKRGREARQMFERLPEGDEQRRQVALTAASAGSEFEQTATAAWEQLLVTLKEAEAGHIAADLVQIGRALSRGIASAQGGKGSLDALIGDPLRPQGRELMRDFAEGAEKAEQRVRKVEESYRQMLGAEEFEVITENLFVIAGENRRLVELAAAANGPGEWASIAGRLRVVLAECRSIEGIAEAAATRTPGDRLKWVRKEFGEHRTRIEKILAAGESGPELREPIQTIKRIADAAANNCLGNFNDLAQRAVNEHLELVRETQPTWSHFEKLREDLARLSSRKEWPEALRVELAERRWETRGLLLKQHGDLEESRAVADTQFLNDTRITTFALDALRMKAATATPDETKKQLVALDKDFRLLETGHSVAELLDGLQHLAAAERWEIATAHERTAGPRDWRWIESRLRFTPEELNRIQADEPLRAVVQQAQRLLGTLGQLPAWNELNREMNERFIPQREPVSTARNLAPIAAQVKQALDLLRLPMDEARQRLAALAPKLNEIMADLAKKSEELKEKTDEQAKEVAEKKPEQAQADAQQALAQQQKLTERVEALKDALRADANQQDILKDEGRERARDADDALALLKEPPPNAEAALEAAAQAPEAAQKAEALQAAAQEQQKLASALDQLAKHYENAEQGKAQDSRAALRKTEEQTGIKEAMEQQFAKAEELQKMSEESPEELLKKLEAALPKNPLMQQELSNIARNNLDDAMKKLTAASTTENQVAQNVQKLASEQPPAAPTSPQPATPPQDAAAAPAAKPDAAQPGQPPPAQPPMPQQNPALAQAAQQQKPIAQAAMEAGEDVARAGRHEQRLNNTPVGEKLEALGNQVKETARTKVPEAEQALNQAQQPAQATPAVNAANEQLQKQVGELKQAAASPKADAAPPAAADAKPGDAPPQAQAANSPAPPSPQPKSGEPSAPTPQNAANAPKPSPMAQAPGTPESAQPAGQTPASGDVPPMPQLPAAFAQTPTTPTAPPTPVEQMWMARTLDALDAALNAEPPADGESPDGSQQPNGQQAQQGQQGKDGKPGEQKSQQPGQQPGQQMSSAQQAMNNAAKAAAAAMRASRSPKPTQNQGDPTNDDGPEQQVSRSGAQAQAAGKAYGKLQNAGGKAGEWGKLPKQVAEQLTRGQNENVAGEYRNQVETYYKVIAEKSKKP